MPSLFIWASRRRIVHVTSHKGMKRRTYYSTAGKSVNRRCERRMTTGTSVHLRTLIIDNDLPV